MLFKVIVSPSIFQDPNYGTLIGLLREIEKNCIILVDQENVLSKQFYASLNQIPIKYRKKVQELYRSIQKFNRVVSSQIQLQDNCCNLLTQLSIISNNQEPLLFGQSCSIEFSTILPKSRIVPVIDYAVSKFMENKRDSYTSVPTDRWTKSKFESLILKPLFETAKRIRIFDRYIGRSMMKENKPIQFSERYRKNLEWIIEYFLQESHRKNESLFEIYTGVNIHDFSEEDINYLKRVVNDFRKYIQNKFDFQVDIILKRENIGLDELPHARYLITDQIGVLIETGFDLFLTDDQMSFYCRNELKRNWNPREDELRIRDVTIARIDNSNLSGITSSFNRLPTI